MFNKIKKNKEIFNWIYPRIYVLLALFVDSSLFLIFIVKSTDDISLTNINTFLILISWIIISYIFGRYSDYNNNNLINLSNQSFKLIILYFFLNLVKGIFFIFYTIDNQLLIFRNFNLFYLYYASISLIGLMTINILIFKRKNKYKNIYFMGSDNDFNILKENIYLKKDNLNLSKIDINKFESFNLEDINFKNKSLLIVSNNYNFSSSELDFFKKIKKKNIVVYGLVNWLDKEYQLIPSELISDIDLVTDNINKINKPIQMRLKRIGDLLISGFLLLALSPLIVISCLFIYLEDGNPIFYSQIRSGLNQEPIRIYKLRTMYRNAEKNGAQWSSENDTRLTKCGKILRRIRIDELPQLLSVMTGEMSLIGPRPERPSLEQELKREIPFYEYRYSIKPGLSGWAQVNYPYGASLKDTQIKLSYDFYYIKNYSFFLDVLIFLKTIKLVLNAKGAIAKNQT